jgi:hypothetical protein
MSGMKWNSDRESRLRVQRSLSRATSNSRSESTNAMVPKTAVSGRADGLIAFNENAPAAFYCLNRFNP